MSLYYFHLRDGVDILVDEEGRQLDGLAALQRAALADARCIMSEDAKEGRLRLDLRIDVEDEFRAIVHSLKFEDAIVITHPAVR
jgi:hypothetical protein